jgi:hypothetical protein
MRGLLVGSWSRVVVKQESCTGGRVAAFNGVETYNGATAPNTLPWHWTYQLFTGALPSVTAIQYAISGLRWGFRDSTAVCTGQYGTTEDAVSLTAAREAGGGITSFTPVEGANSVTLFRRDGGFVCPSPMRIRGVGSLTVQGAATRVTVFLI